MISSKKLKIETDHWLQIIQPWAIGVSTVLSHQINTYTSSQTNAAPWFTMLWWWWWSTQKQVLYYYYCIIAVIISFWGWDITEASIRRDITTWKNLASVQPESPMLYPYPNGSLYRFVYLLALLAAVTFLPVTLGRHVQTSPGTMMTVSSAGWKRDHP